jgi:lambda family phage tail tape measure protein
MGASTLLKNILEGVANALRFLADHIEIVSGALIALTITAIPKLIAALVALAPMLGLLALGAGIGALVAFRYEIKASEDSIATLGDVASATWERIKSGISTLYDAIRSQFPGLGEMLTNMFGDLDVSLEGFITGAARVLDRFIGFWRATINVIVALYEGLGPALQDITIDFMNDIISIMDAGFRKFFSLLGRIPGRVGRPYRRLAEEGVIPRLDNMAEGATERLKSSIVDGFAKGFDEITVFEDSVNAIFDRADEIAKERIAQSAETLEAGAAGPLAAPTGGGAPTPQGQQLGFQQALANLRRQVELLRMSNSERAVQNELLKAENQLRELGAELDENQREQLETELTRLQLIRQVSEALDEVRGTEIDLAAAQEELNARVEAGNISLDEATKALRLLEDQVNQTATTINVGFQRGLSSIWREINDFATQTENTLVNAFHSAEDALVDFVKTGKMDFKSLVDSILGDLTRLIARMLLVKAIEAIGGGSNPLGAIFGGGKAGGGDVSPGTVYEVGEKGTELFAPAVPGQIISNDRIQKAVGAEERPEGDREEGAVTVVVVDSMEKALSAMETAEGRRIIINTVDENKREMG